MGIILGIDPGTRESGYAIVNSQYYLLESGKTDNEDVISRMIFGGGKVDSIIIESLHYYGKPIGRETFETAYWIGEFRRIAKDRNIPWYLYPKPEYARYVCGTLKTDDATIWRALKLRFGGDKKGEPLNQLKGDTDKRSAYALCVYHLDKVGRDLIRAASERKMERERG